MENATNTKAFDYAQEKESAGNAVSKESAIRAAEEEEKRRQEEECRAHLARLEYEIQTLRNVLLAKMDEASELKRKLGITPIIELKQDLKTGIQTIKESETVQKTNAALRSFGDFASRKMSDLRNSNTFRSVEERVGEAYTSVKKRVSMSNDNLDGPMSPKEQPQQTATQLSPASDGGEELANMLPESKKADAQ